MDRNNNNTTAQSDIERNAIRNVQRYLRHLSFHSEEIDDLPIDGIWEKDTRQALIAFQRKHSIPATGVVDKNTWEILKEKYDESVAMNSPPVMLALFPRFPQGFEIKQGDKGYLVDTVQFLLGELERLFFFPKVPITGTYDELTAELVKDFQKRNNIPITGNVGRETWDALAVQHNILLKYDE